MQRGPGTANVPFRRVEPRGSGRVVRLTQSGITQLGLQETGQFKEAATSGTLHIDVRTRGHGGMTGIDTQTNELGEFKIKELDMFQDQGAK
jgi:hypothetical protein